MRITSNKSQSLLLPVSPACVLANRWPPGRRRYTQRFLVCTASLILALVAFAASAAGMAPSARADGGAPNLAYVSGTKDGVAVIDLASQKITDTISLAGDPRGMALSADYRFLYVALAGKNGVAVIDANAKQVTNTYPTGPGPMALMLDLVDPSHLWVANSGGNTVTVLNPDSGKQVATIPVGQHPTGVNIAAPGSGISETDGSSEVFVANHDSSSIAVIGSESFKVITTVALPNGENPLWVTIPALGGNAYVTTQQGHVYGLTLASHQVFGPIFTGQSLHFMDYDATNGEVYVPDSQTNLINVLHPAGLDPKSWTGEPVRALAVAGGPTAVAITSDGSLGLVAQHDSGDVTLLEVPTRKALGQVHVGGAPQFVLAGPFPPLVNRQSAQVILIVISVLAGILLVGGVGWVIWWMRKQERRIHQLHALEDAEYERQVLAAQAISEVKEQSATAEQRGRARSLAPPSNQQTDEAPGASASDQPRQRPGANGSKLQPKGQKKRKKAGS